MSPNMCDGFGCSSSTGPFEPNAYGTFEGTRNRKGGRLDVDSSGADHKHSSKAIQNTQSVYRISKNGTQCITNPDASAAGKPKDTMPRKDRSVW